MTPPPTWRDLGRRARRLGINLQHGRHEASLVGPSLDHPRQDVAPTDCRFVSWTTCNAADSIILRTAIAAALEQLEAGR